MTLMISVLTVWCKYKLFVSRIIKVGERFGVDVAEEGAFRFGVKRRNFWASGC